MAGELKTAVARQAPWLGRSARDRVLTSALAVDVAIAGAAALVLGLIRLGTPSLWVDESYTAWRVDRSLAESIEGYHWLYQVVLEPWALVAGTSEWALRLPSVLGAMLACGLLVVLARELVDRRVALLSGLFLATSPFYVKWSQQARGYALLVAVGLVATLLLIRAIERGSRASWALYGLGLSAAIVWHPVAGLVLLPGHVVLMIQRRERVLPHGLLAGIIACALGGFWAGQILERSTGEGEGQALNWLKAPSAEVAARTLLDVSGAAGVGLVLAIAGLVVLVRARRRDLAVWLGAWAFAPFALTLLVSTVRPVYLDRYLITAAPAFALLAGIAVAGVARRLRPVLVLAALVATSAGLVAWYSKSDGGGNWRGEDWRSAVGFVLEQRSTEEPILVAAWSARAAATYYGADVTDVSTADSIWVLRWSETGEGLADDKRRGLGFGEHRLVERRQFGRRVSAQLWQRDP